VKWAEAWAETGVNVINFSGATLWPQSLHEHQLASRLKP